MYEIAERFPPLRERAQTWSLDRLLDEFGRGMTLDPVGSAERDSVLMSELVKREFTLEDATRIANYPARTEYIRQYRAYVMISAIVNSGGGVQFEAFFRDELLRAIAKKPTEVIGMILHETLRVPSIDVSDLAVQCTGLAGNNTSEALHYLESKGHTREIYDALQKLDVGYHETARQRALSAIEARLH
jgi:hypothetical protein